ncbi:response regulator [bacterium]|nr:response regulator [bacterium]
MANILIAEDEERMRRLLAMLLGNKGHELVLCADGEEAVQKFSDQPTDVVLTDLRIPKLSGVEVIERIRAISPEVPIIVMTAYGSIESAVEAMRKGATDYITKPFDEARLHLAIEGALEKGRLIAENRVLRTELRSRYGFEAIVAESPQFLEVLDLARQVASSNSTVVIYGESGTGKELVSRAIHESSNRARGPFVAINCAAIPENLLESELFGHERGAFTGAQEAKRGKFELASGGTLFLDEIGELALPLQAKVLRAIESQEFERVGGLKTVHTDIRFVAATNRNLADMVREGDFREDLFYRLNVFPLVIPPLRDRPGDIIPLTEAFLRRFCREMGRKVPIITPEAEEMLLSHRWDGNVRELQNAIERAVILMKKDQLTPDLLRIDTLARLRSLGSSKQLSETGPSLGLGQSNAGPKAVAESPAESTGTRGDASLPWRPFRIPEVGFNLEDHEKQLLHQALSRTKNNKSAAAKLLGLTRATLRYRLEKFGLVEESKGKDAADSDEG